MDKNDGIRSVWLLDGRELSVLCDRYVGQPTAMLENLGKDTSRTRAVQGHRPQMVILEARLPFIKECLTLQCWMRGLMMSLGNITLAVENGERSEVGRGWDGTAVSWWLRQDGPVDPGLELKQLAPSRRQWSGWQHRRRSRSVQWASAK